MTSRGDLTACKWLDMGLPLTLVTVQGGYQAPPCAHTCHELACTDINLRYGKYCGVGHGGCPGGYAYYYLLMFSQAAEMLYDAQGTVDHLQYNFR